MRIVDNPAIRYVLLLGAPKRVGKISTATPIRSINIPKYFNAFIVDNFNYLLFYAQITA
jgi:hypothetical protein